jgi:hypothetical protein
MAGSPSISIGIMEAGLSLVILTQGAVLPPSHQRPWLPKSTSNSWATSSEAMFAEITPLYLKVESG